MKFLFKKDMYDWRMTGFIGDDNSWFLGFSENRNSKRVLKKDAENLLKGIHKTNWRRYYDL